MLLILFVCYCFYSIVVFCRLIRKGKVQDLNDGQRDNLLVDFDRRDWDVPTDSEEEESEEDNAVSLLSLFR